MPTTRVSTFRCGTVHSGWLDGVHPTVEEGKVHRMVCFSHRSTGCEHLKKIFVKNVMCVTVVQTECRTKMLGNKRTHKLILRYT